LSVSRLSLDGAPVLVAGRVVDRTAVDAAVVRVLRERHSAHRQDSARSERRVRLGVPVDDDGDDAAPGVADVALDLHGPHYVTSDGCGTRLRLRAARPRVRGATASALRPRPL